MKVEPKLLRRLCEAFCLPQRSLPERDDPAQEIFDLIPEVTFTQLNDVLERLDGTLGKGFSKDHPELVGALVITCAVNFHTALVVNKLRTIAGCIPGD